MLENIRDKIHNVQQDLSATIRHLATPETNFPRIKKSIPKCRINAGAELLDYYQTNWHQIHSKSEENAKAAEKIAQVIATLHATCQQQTASVQQLTNQLALLPDLQKSLLTLMDKIGELEGLFGDIECALVNLEDIMETQQLQEQQLDRRFQLALYERGKQAQLDQLKVRLAGEHAALAQEHERRQKIIQKERQAVFQEAFEEEMRQYRAHGKIERLPSGPPPIDPAIDLASIVLEDEEEKQALDQFLGDTSLEENEVPISGSSDKKEDASTH